VEMTKLHYESRWDVSTKFLSVTMRSLGLWLYWKTSGDGQTPQDAVEYRICPAQTLQLVRVLVPSEPAGTRGVKLLLGSS
jgi:hypothetical protein